MGLRTAAAYLEGLRDGRTIYFRGERVPDLMEHPELRAGAEHTALDYRLAEDEAHRDLFTAVSPRRVSASAATSFPLLTRKTC